MISQSVNIWILSAKLFGVRAVNRFTDLSFCPSVSGTEVRILSLQKMQSAVGECLCLVRSGHQQGECFSMCKATQLSVQYFANNCSKSGVSTVKRDFI